jgi:hypothetical protein
MRAATVSSESIASHPPPAGAVETCAACGAPLAGDQRYCLECGERRAPISSVLLGGPAGGTSQQPESPARPGAVPPDTIAPGGSRAAPPPGAPRSNAVTVIAAVGVLLLAMGVGVLIGRAGAGTKTTAAAPQVISVGTAAAAGGAAAAAGEEAASFTSDWPAGTNGYTVQLQTLPESGTQTSAVESAKTAAGTKGAKDVGALRSDDFGLSAGNYVIYSGLYHKKPEAEKALAGLKKQFPGAKVIKVSSSAGGAGASGATSPKAGGSGAAGSGAAGSEGKPAPPTVLKELRKTKGKSYEEKSKNLPNQVET